MAEEVKQEPQFKVFGADKVKFTVKSVDSVEKLINVSISCDELKEQPEDIWIDATTLEAGVPTRMQIADRVFGIVAQQKIRESDCSGNLSDANNIKNQEQTVTATELEVHKEAMHKQRANHYDPLLTQTQITTIFHEDDFDFQFENLMKELNE
tara:strand:- start:1762 stop:2220 length:459 start_codon:yes stop_codon:yes gene_type:complete